MKPHFFLSAVLLSSYLTTEPNLLAADEPQVSFRCDSEGNLHSFRYGNDLTFDSALGAANCDEVNDAILRCSAEPENKESDLAAVQKIFDFLAEDPDLRKELLAGKSASQLMNSQLTEMRAFCLRKNGSAQSGKSFDYSYPFNGYTKRNIGSNGANTMNKEQFRRVAELAIAGGIDPFLAMSILVTEQTPLQMNQETTEAYFRGYGVFPVDARPAYSFLKCSLEKSEFSQYLRSSGNPLKPHLAQLDKIRSEADAQGGTISDRVNELAHQRESLETSIHLNPGGASDPRKERLKKINAAVDEWNTKYNAIYHGSIAKIPGSDNPYQRKLMEQYVTCWKSCVGIMPGQCRKEECQGAEPPTFDFGSSTKDQVTRIYCSNEGAINNGSNPVFTYSDNGPPLQGECCYKIKGPASSPAFKDSSHFLGALGLRTFWDDKMLRGLKIVKPKGAKIGENLGAEDAHRLARIAQMWNGWGKLNVTEKIQSCMGQIDMAQSPVIGAKAMDLMINSTMTNPYLAEAVMDLARKYKKPVKSMLCLYGGAGKKRMSAKAFHQQLNSRYLSGTNCR